MCPSASSAVRIVAATLFGLVAALVSAAVLADDDARSVEGGAPLLTSIDPSEWTTYKRRFLDPSGRIVDVEKNGVTHSEGQGYGMLLAVKANDRDAFDRILGFTYAHMRGRTDGLVSWLYDPRRHPPLADPNNASDGDILIAYALVLGAVKWNEPVYLARATPLIHAIGGSLLVRHESFVVVRPAAFGFDGRDQSDGPVANLSYYIYGAFLLFEAVEPAYPWIEAWQSGLMLTHAVHSGAGGVGAVPDWVSLARGRFLAPAANFRAASSYDAVRIPLYMALGGRVPAEYFAAFDAAWSGGVPTKVALGGRRTRQVMPDPGYRAIAAVAACASRGAPLPHEVRQFRTTTYFASTLHLLALAAVRENYPECLIDAVGDATPPRFGRYDIGTARG
jgi:endoglucanase